MLVVHSNWFININLFIIYSCCKRHPDVIPEFLKLHFKGTSGFAHIREFTGKFENIHTILSVAVQISLYTVLVTHVWVREIFTTDKRVANIAGSGWSLYILVPKVSLN